MTTMDRISIMSWFITVLVKHWRYDGSSETRGMCNDKRSIATLSLTVCVTWRGAMNMMMMMMMLLLATGVVVVAVSIVMTIAITCSKPHSEENH